MARMNTDQFIKYCNDMPPDDLLGRKVTAQDLLLWRQQSNLEPEKIGEGTFYYERHYWLVLNLLYAEKEEAERPQRELAKRKRRKAQKRKKIGLTKVWHREHPEYLPHWEKTHPESRRERNRRYYLTKKRKKELLDK